MFKALSYKYVQGWISTQLEVSSFSLSVAQSLFLTFSHGLEGIIARLIAPPSVWWPNANITPGVRVVWYVVPIRHHSS